ncbi:MAG TPA: hypothetical protein VKE98_06840 [Gemmataceae bacterium]|nr:hypothetical protein [Gemmataceae bacterium]
MRRYAGVMLILCTLGGCSLETGGGGPGPGGGAPPCGYGGGGYRPGAGHDMAPPAVPGVQGPWGQNVAMCSPYSSCPPGAMAAMNMMRESSIPLNMVQMAGVGAGSMPGAPPGANMPGIVPAGMLSPPGVPPMPGANGGNDLMTADMPPGGTQKGGITQANYPPGAVAFLPGLESQPRFPTQRTQVRFVRPSFMEVSWFTQGADGKPSYSDNPIHVPGRYNFLQGAIYRLRLKNIEGRPGLEVYPTLEVVPTNYKTEAFLAHSSVPISFTDEDFKQITEGNYVVKVIYLPDPQYQELAGAGTEEILSTRLEPGADPIQEALRRGSILLVIRMGNMDQEAPNTPPMGTPGPGGAPCPPGMPPASFSGLGFGMGPPMGPMGPMPPNMAGPMGPMGPNMGPMGPMGPMPPNMAGPMGPMGPMPPNMARPIGPMGPMGPMPPNMARPMGPMPPNMGGPMGPMPPNMAGPMGPTGPVPPNMAGPPPSNPFGPMGPPPSITPPPGPFLVPNGPKGPSAPVTAPSLGPTPTDVPAPKGPVSGIGTPPSLTETIGGGLPESVRPAPPPLSGSGSSNPITPPATTPPVSTPPPSSSSGTGAGGPFSGLPSSTSLLPSIVPTSTGNTTGSR